MNGEVYNMVISSDMTYGLEMVVLTKRQEAELKVFRFSLGVTRMDEIGNERDSSG